MQTPVDGSRIQLRRARRDDARSVGLLWHEAWVAGHQGLVPDELLPYRTRDSFLARAAAHLGITTVATVEGKLAGFIMVSGDEVEQVFVGRAFRGRGVAGPLLAEAERQVVAAGYARAWLAVAEGNLRARRFYERQGWHDAGPLSYRAAAGQRRIAVASRRYEKSLAPVAPAGR